MSREYKFEMKQNGNQYAGWLHNDESLENDETQVIEPIARKQQTLDFMKNAVGFMKKWGITKIEATKL